MNILSEMFQEFGKAIQMFGDMFANIFCVPKPKEPDFESILRLVNEHEEELEDE